nr:hypothetical protein [uncultured bacterium]
MRRILATISAILMIVILGHIAGAQDASPAAYPMAPDPADCRVEPRSIESVTAAVGTPTASDPAAASSPTPFVRPEGQPADNATSEAVTGTVHELFACANAGDFLRIFALYTDDFLRDFLAGTPVNEEVIALFTASPVPLPEQEMRVIIRIEEVQILPDGRAGVVVVLDEPDDPRTEEPDYVILERDGDRWLIDEVIEDGGMEATPAP